MLIFLSSPEDMLIDFRERGREEEEREGEKHQGEKETSISFPVLIREGTCNLGMYPGWESNPLCFSLQDDAPTEPHWPRLLY